MKSPKIKRTLRALGIKQEKPAELVGHEDATKPYRFKKGENRVQKNNLGARAQLIPPRSMLKARARVSEILKELQEQPVAKELAKLMGLPEDVTVAQAIAFSLVWQALSGDVNAIKHLQLNTENLRDGAPTMPAGPPPSLSIVWVKPDGTKVREREQLPPEAPKPTIEYEFDFTGRTECPEGFFERAPGVFESEPLPPLAEEKENAECPPDPARSICDTELTHTQKKHGP